MAGTSNPSNLSLHVSAAKIKGIRMIRWHAELYLGNIRRTCPVYADAIYTSTDKQTVISGIMQYVLTMVEPDEDFKIIVKSVSIKEQ